MENPEKISILSNASLPVHQPIARQIIGIDLLRLAAATMVLLYHLTCIDWLPLFHGGVTPTHAFDRVTPYTCYGWLGVPIFFVISGFVIAYSAQGTSASTFVRNRLFRIWPLGAICASICLVIVEIERSPIPHERVLQSYVGTLLFSPFTDPIDGAFWTLPIECCFYALVALTIWLRRLQKLPHVMAWLGGLSMLFWGLGLANQHWSQLFPHALERLLGIISRNNYILIPYGCDFAVGVLLWHILYKSRTPSIICAAAIAAAGGVAQVWYNASLTGPFLGIAVSQVASAVIWLLGVFSICAAVRINHRLHQSLSRAHVKTIRALGLLTYPLYLLNGRVGDYIILRVASKTGFVQGFGAACALLLLISYLLAIEVDPVIQGHLRIRFVACPSTLGLR